MQNLVAIGNEVLNVSFNVMRVRLENDYSRLLGVFLGLQKWETESTFCSLAM